MEEKKTEIKGRRKRNEKKRKFFPTSTWIFLLKKKTYLKPLMENKKNLKILEEEKLLVL